MSNPPYARDLEDTPFAGDALQGVCAPVFENDPRTSDQILDGTRGEDLAGPGESSDTRTDVHGKSADVVTHSLALARVDAGSNLEAGIVEAIADGYGAAHGAGRPVEGGEESVSGRGDLVASKMRELSSDGCVMPFQHVAPGFFAQCCRSFRRADDVRKENGREHSVRLRRRPDAR